MSEQVMVALARSTMVGKRVHLPPQYGAWVKGGLDGTIISAGREQGAVCLRVKMDNRRKLARVWLTDFPDLQIL